MPDGPKDALSCGSNSPPEGTFKSVSSGSGDSCGVRPNGDIVCWGGYRYGHRSAVVTPGPFVDVASGACVCGVRDNGSIECWDCADPLSAPPAGAFVRVEAGESHFCALRADGTVTCWGLRQSAMPPFVPPGYKFTNLSSGAYTACGVEMSARQTVCWMPGGYPDSTRTYAGYTEVAAGRFFNCGLLAAGDLSCWGDDSYGQLRRPGGAFLHVTAGDFHACALRADGSVACWGGNNYGQSTPPSGIRFTQISAGMVHTCGVATDGTVKCWGGNPIYCPE